MLLKKHRASLLAAGMFAVAATGASATTMLQMSFDDLVADSALVVVGEAIDSRVVESAADGLVTITTFRVSDAVLGSSGSVVQVATPGGIFRSGKFLLRESTADTPMFAIGSEHMLFLNSGPQNAFAVVGVNQGAAAVFEGKAGRSVVLPGGKGVETLGEASARVRAERAESDRLRDRETVE
ncbi:MAG TPA: hypothetical protein DDZ68_11710 [Parvularcula sp.]|nr:hypothetical protein [Parvularcula sp.]HBS32003.1 hypothetical protein [Parvularcula sp.]HBS34269.1 hypothetical protein [Parvularcula sp.]